MQRIKHAERGHHGHLKNGARPPEHGIWKKMLQKCYNERCAEFKHCGVLGIHVCDRWRGTDGFVNFLADVGPPPFSGVGLCRIDPNGHFAPGNVEWGDTRTKHMLTYEGRTL